MNICRFVDGRRVGEYYSGTFQCAGSILASEGPLAFWKGFSGHFMRTGPHYVVSFVFIGTNMYVLFFKMFFSMRTGPHDGVCFTSLALSLRTTYNGVSCVVRIKCPYKHNIYIYVNMYMRQTVCICICICVCMYIRMYAYMYIKLRPMPAKVYFLFFLLA